MILMAGLTAYPQATRSARENKSEKGSTKKETVQRKSTRSDASQRSETKAATRERSRSENRQATAERSKSVTSKPEATRSGENARTDNRNTDRRDADISRKSQDQKDVRQNNTERRSETGNAERRTVIRPENKSGNGERRQENTVTRPDNRTGSGDASSRNMRESGNSDDRDFKVRSSSANRVYREGKGTLTRDDGTVFRHQNDEVFGSRRYKLDYDNWENLRRSDEFRRDYRDYDDWYRRRHIRDMHNFRHYNPLPWEIRRSRYYYRVPYHIDLIWTPLLFHRFMYYYPTHNDWSMEFGSRIETISAYEAREFAGVVKRVYGKVAEVFYSPGDENYILYVGAPFPYQDISIVVPKHIARNLT